MSTTKKKRKEKTDILQFKKKKRNYFKLFFFSIYTKCKIDLGLIKRQSTITRMKEI